MAAPDPEEKVKVPRRASVASALIVLAASLVAKKPFWAKIGQSFNPSGLVQFGNVLKGGGVLALPHLSAPDISHVCWPKLKDAGFKGCVFDKDNTLTEPYAEVVAPRVAASLDACKQTWPGKVVLFSNSAGLEEFDPDGKEAARVSTALGIPVLKHKGKKPGGDATELEEYFGCPARELVMVGDRYLTDIVFGNRLGMLTVRTAPLTKRGEPFVVLQTRKFEDSRVHKWRQQGKVAPPHPLNMGSILQGAVFEMADVPLKR